MAHFGDARRLAVIILGLSPALFAQGNSDSARLRDLNIEVLRLRGLLNAAAARGDHPATLAAPRRARKIPWATIMIYVALVFGAFFMVMPFVYMLSTSLKPANQVFLFPPRWIPSPVMWANYPTAAVRLTLQAFLNSVIFTTAIVVGQGLVTRRLVPRKAPPPPKRSSRTPPKEVQAESTDGAEPKAADEKPAVPAAPRRVKRKKKQARR